MMRKNMYDQRFLLSFVEQLRNISDFLSIPVQTDGQYLSSGYFNTDGICDTLPNTLEFNELQICESANLDADIAEINIILSRVAGPRVSKLLIDLTTTLTNEILKGVPLEILLHPVVRLVFKTAKQGGSLEKLLAGGNRGALEGKGKNLTPAVQEALCKVLQRTVGPYNALFIVRTVGIAGNGLLGKLHLDELLHGVTGLVKNVAKPKGLVGKIIGQKELGKPISKLLGAKGPIA